MTKRIINQVYVNHDDMGGKNIEEVLLASIGRKRSGVIRMRYYHVMADEPKGHVHNLSTLVSYKFKREMESLAHQIDDRPKVMDMIHGDIPWVGLIELSDPEADIKYKVEGHIRNMVLADNMVFQLRDLRDGSSYNEGLMLLHLGVNPIDKSVDVTTTAGLKQKTVVEKFQGYFEALDTLKTYLLQLGYTQCPDRSNHLQMHHKGEVVSTIEIALVGRVDT